MTDVWIIEFYHPRGDWQQSTLAIPQKDSIARSQQKQASHKPCSLDLAMTCMIVFKREPFLDFSKYRLRNVETGDIIMAAIL